MKNHHMASMLAAIAIGSNLPLAQYDEDGDTRLIVRNKARPRADSAERMAAAEAKRKRKNARQVPPPQNSGEP